MPKSAAETNGERAPTVYSQTFLDELTDRGILEQQFRANEFVLDKPSNYIGIRNAINKGRPKDKATEADYKKYTKKVFSVGNEAATGKVLYPLLLGKLDAEEPHVQQHDAQWKKHKRINGKRDIVKCKQLPKPDMAEGLLASEVPDWIRDLLGGYVVPRAGMAFPNYLVELKRDGSMYTAHVQNRHCGAVASQAFVEYMTQIGADPKLAWNTARVGSIEFNGHVVIGNVHWVRSPDESGADRKVRTYHMAQVMCHVTYGMDYEDFVTARRETRNFQEYFEADRETFLKEMVEKQHLEQRENNPPASANGAEEEGDEEEEEQEESADEDHDSIVSEPPAASQMKSITRPAPAAQKKRQSSTTNKRRSENENNITATCGGTQANKKVKSGGRKSKSNNVGEHTNLTQETQNCEIVE